MEYFANRELQTCCVSDLPSVISADLSADQRCIRSISADEKQLSLFILCPPTILILREPTWLGFGLVKDVRAEN